MDGSKRSAHSNAYFFGLWKNKRIVLYDTLLIQMKKREIISVIGHELGHWKYNHVKWNFLLFTVKIFFLFYIFQFFLNND